MAAIENMSADVAEIAEWRRHLHRNPELLYDVHRTADFVAEKLRAFGCDEVVTGIGRTGVVGIIRGKRASKHVVGLRADMDALPIHEQTNLAWASQTPGMMHACGHDGHTAMLLGAARELCAKRDFAGTAIVVFQPAEEGGAGGKAMVDDGLITRFAIERIFGLHNIPGLPLGHFALRPGPLMASADRFDIVITGKGGHAAMPHLCIDPIVVGSQMVGALQTIASRGVDPLEAVVVSVTRFEAGASYNVIPSEARIAGTIRTLTPAIRAFARKRLIEIAEGAGRMNGAEVAVTMHVGYPVTVNDSAQTDFAAGVARAVAGDAKVDTSIAPVMGAEDFSYMLEACPGAFIFMGNGNTAGLHHPAYDFNDAAIPAGTSYWVKLVETALAA